MRRKIGLYNPVACPPSLPDIPWSTRYTHHEGFRHRLCAHLLRSSCRRSGWSLRIRHLPDRYNHPPVSTHLYVDNRDLQVATPLQSPAMAPPVRSSVPSLLEWARPLPSSHATLGWERAPPRVSRLAFLRFLEHANHTPAVW